MSDQIVPPEPPEPSEPLEPPEQPEVQPTWRRSLRDVSRVAVSVVVIVLAAAFVTDFLPSGVRGLIVDTPLAIAVLIVGTAWLLWRIAGKRSDPAS